MEKSKAFINYTQTEILLSLLKMENKNTMHITPTKLSNQIGMKKSNITVELKKLEDGMYLEFYKDSEKDRRNKFVRLTKFGKAWAWWLRFQNLIPIFYTPARDQDLEELARFFSRTFNGLKKRKIGDENEND